MLEFQITTDDVERAAELIIRPLEGCLKTDEMLALFRDAEFKLHIRKAVNAWLQKPQEIEWQPMPRIEPMPSEQFDAKLAEFEKTRKASKKPQK